jgi:hypothetical protein
VKTSVNTLSAATQIAAVQGNGPRGKARAHGQWCTITESLILGAGTSGSVVAGPLL